MTTAAEMGALQLQAKEGQRTQRAELMAQMGKNLPANQEAWVRSLGREDSLKQEMEEGNGRKQRSLVGYSSWDCKELGMTE